MEGFLLKAAHGYKFIIYNFIWGAIIYVVLIGGFTEITIGTAMNEAFSLVEWVFVSFFEYIMVPLYKIVIGMGSWVMDDLWKNSDTGFIGLIFGLFVIMLAMGGLFFITVYFPFNFLIMPLWVIIDEKMIPIWIMTLGPGFIMGQSGEFVDQYTNMMYMENENEVIKTLAVNKDLADQINNGQKS